MVNINLLTRLLDYIMKGSKYCIHIYFNEMLVVIEYNHVYVYTNKYIIILIEKNGIVKITINRLSGDIINFSTKQIETILITTFDTLNDGFNVEKVSMTHSENIRCLGLKN